VKIAFRVDASIHIGTGHVMRCLTLADEFRRRGAESTFIFRLHKNNFLYEILQRGHKAVALPETGEVFEPDSSEINYSSWLGVDWGLDAEQTNKVLCRQIPDWLIVDHYALDQNWEKAVRSNCNRLMVIDDLANRAHECDLLLDQNLGRNKKDYLVLLPKQAEILIGPKYTLLRPEFERLRSRSLKRRIKPELKRLLITLGGIDKENITEQVLSSVEASDLPKDLIITVVMGQNAPWISRVRAKAREIACPIKVFEGVKNMAQLMMESDLAIGAAGSAAWERCCLGLPTIQLILAKNQIEIARALELKGAVIGSDKENLFKNLKQIFFDPTSVDLLSKIALNSSNVLDGQGVFRVANYLGKRI
jgi:UDP-2,4-diacetamido-2,4,6-trideoxy-beta-L-altropyranose hydrolase